MLNYYNPDDYALASWRMDQALKPTASYPVISNDPDRESLNSVRSLVDFGAVSLTEEAGVLDLWYAATGVVRGGAGFGGIEYMYMPYEGMNYFVRTSLTRLTLQANLYEMFAFCASSIVAPVGGVQDMRGLAAPLFTRGEDLSKIVAADGSTKWNTKHTGHSAQYVHSYLDVSGYWQKLVEDVE